MKRTLLVVLLGGLAGNISVWAADPSLAFTAGNILVPALPGIIAGLVGLFVPSPVQDFIRGLLDRE
jgi:hypothetical protein